MSGFESKSPEPPLGFGGLIGSDLPCCYRPTGFAGSSVDTGSAGTHDAIAAHRRNTPSAGSRSDRPFDEAAPSVAGVVAAVPVLTAELAPAEIALVSPARLARAGGHTA